jgi:hypothetical protein
MRAFDAVDCIISRDVGEPQRRVSLTVAMRPLSTTEHRFGNDVSTTWQRYGYGAIQLLRRCSRATTGRLVDGHYASA